MNHSFGEFLTKGRRHILNVGGTVPGQGSRSEEGDQQAELSAAFTSLCFLIYLNDASKHPSSAVPSLLWSLCSLESLAIVYSIRAESKVINELLILYV